MTGQSLAIPRGAPADPALDWGALCEQGLERLRACAADHWSDFNAHDPGVTILEQLCFALTEIGHRAGLPVADLLTAADGRMPASGRTLRRPWRVLPTEPVTIADWRMLLIDRLPGLRNAWLTARRDAEAGLYDLALQAAPDADGARLARRAERLFVRHRALCEDLATVRLLRPVRLGVGGRVTLAPGADAEAVAARIAWRLARLAAPEPRRRRLDALLAEGRTRAEMLDGPLPRRGFVDADELGARVTELAAAVAHAVIAAVPGVASVAAVRLRIGDGEWQNRVASGAEGWLSVDPDDVALGLGADAAAVRRLVGQRRARADASEDPRAALRRAFAPPAGRARDVAAYTPVADHFPGVYGIGAGGLTSAASPARRAEAKQLLGYLALFDRQLIDALDRLAALPDLIAGEESVAARLERPLAEAVPRLAPLLRDDGPDADALYGRAALPADQQRRLLDFLLALHGEAPIVPRPPGLGAAAAAAHGLKVRRTLLRRLALAARGRGRGLDYRAKRSRRGIAGVELRGRILLGAYDLERSERPRVTVVEHVLLREDGAAPAPGAALRATAVVHLPGADARWRREAATMLRAEAPAHVALDLLFLDAGQWRRFRRAHRMWRVAMRARDGESTGWLGGRIAGMIAGWAAGDSGGEGEGGTWEI